MHPSLFTSSMTHGDEREQSRNSPRYLLEAGLQAARIRRYTLDPASNPDALVNAHTEVWYGGVPGAAPVPIQGMRGRMRGDGLELDWRPYRHVFSNPPWNNIGAFLLKVMALAQWHRERGTKRWSIQLLLPLRPHRAYWGPAYSADAWCLLHPVAYVGFDDKIATPCVWLYWGSDVECFRSVFHGRHGVVLTSFPDLDILSPVPSSKPNSRKSNVERNNEAMMEMLRLVLSDMSTEAIADVVRRVFVGRPVMDLVWFEAGAGFPFEGGRNAALNHRITAAATLVLEGTSVADPTAKKAPARKTRAKKAPAKKASAKKAPAKKAPAKKTSAKKAPAKKTSKKAPAKKTSAKKTSAKKTSAKKAPPKKAPAKKTSAKKTSAKKAPPKKTSRKSAPVTLSGTLGDGSPIVRGMTVCRRDNPSKVGVVVGDAGSCSVVRWGNDKTGVKVIKIDLIGTVRETKGTRAAQAELEAANQNPSKTARLDKAVETEILAGRGSIPVTCQDVATAMKVSAPTALRSLRRLMEAGKVATTGSGRKRAYVSQVPAQQEQAAG